MLYFPPTTVYSVSQVTGHIRGLLEGDELLGDVWLSGEVSNFKQAVSGHCYFTLKDAEASIRAVIWRTQAQSMTLPREGDAVIAHGYVTVYEQRGDYQLYVDRLQPGGVGWLWQEFQRLKERLEAEGLFAAERKRPIPAMPRCVGVVTSSSAAALHDILTTLRARCPLVRVVLAAAPVQGDQAPEGIVAALRLLECWAQQFEPLDAVIVARGGGSIEELWAFNDERVARAIAACCAPVITGVGHETDFTIADFVADLRAPTPTGAAAAAVPDMRELQASVQTLAATAQDLVVQRIDGARVGVQGLAGRLARLSPEAGIARDRQRVDELSRRAGQALLFRMRTWRERLAGQRLYLSAMDPGAVLKRGYAIVTDQRRLVVGSVSQVAPGDVVYVRLADGHFRAVVQADGTGAAASGGRAGHGPADATG